MLQKGDQQQITIGSICAMATVKQVEPYQDKGVTGAFVIFDVPGKDKLCSDAPKPERDAKGIYIQAW